MVDTVKVRFRGEVCGDIEPHRRLTLPGGEGVRFYYDRLGNCKAEAELPRLLWGHNGNLLANQKELDDSVTRFRSILSQWVKFASWEWVLIDLVWQFQTRPEDVILAYQWTRFPGVRSLPSLFYGGKQISWRGGRRGLKLYRKAKGVLRVELRLAGLQLRTRIDDNGLLDFAELYRVFRADVLKLSPVRLPEARKHSLAEIVAALPMELQNTAILRYQVGRSTRAVNGFKRDISDARLKRTDWNLRDLLPAERLPPVVNIEPEKRNCRATGKREPYKNGLPFGRADA